MIVLGLDLGTSGLKGVLTNSEQQVIASHTAPLTVSRPHPGWSEQNPADWIRAAEQVLDALKADYPAELAAVEGIGLSGQMHGATLLAADGQVLRPCILWNDTRSHVEAMMLDQQAMFRQISGNLVFPGFTAPKLLWVKQHEPEVFSKIAKVLLPKDYLRYWLSGEWVAECSDAAGTSWLDVKNRCWSSLLLEASGVTLEQMPSLIEGTEISGQLRPELSARWGMRQAVIAGGAGDNAASAVATGCVAAGSGFVSLGTSGVLFAANDQYRPKPESAVHTFCHALPQTWHQMGVILSAASALGWFANTVGSTPAKLTAALGDSLRSPSESLFLPYLSGERTPHNNAHVRGAFVGLSHESDTTALTATVMEGVAYALRDNLEVLRSTGTDLNQVIAVGGGSRSRYWLSVLATVLQIPIHMPADGDYGAAFGAARLGLMAVSGADAASVCSPPAIARTVEPDPSLSEAFAVAYQNYRQLYPALAKRVGHNSNYI